LTQVQIEQPPRESPNSDARTRTVRERYADALREAGGELRSEEAAKPRSAPEQTAPEQTAPEQTAPEQTAPEQTAPKPRKRSVVHRSTMAVGGATVRSAAFAAKHAARAAGRAIEYSQTPSKPYFTDEGRRERARVRAQFKQTHPWANVENWEREVVKHMAEKSRSTRGKPKP